MIIGFNPTVSNKTDFKALPIEKIIKNGPEADMFRMDVSKGKYKKTDENVSHLNVAYNITKNILIKAYLNDVAKMWGVKFD